MWAPLPPDLTTQFGENDTENDDKEITLLHFFYNQIKSDRIPFSVSNRERMKRSQDRDEDLTGVDNPSVTNTNRKKKRKAEEEEEEEEYPKNGFCDLNGDLLFEVLKYLDARSLATATCVSKQWHRTAQDERLWELLCTRHCRNIGCGNQQLRSVVLALGGFRRLHSLYLRPLLKPTSSSSLSLLIPSNNPSSSSSSSSTPPSHWGKDEVNLSLSLLSIRYYEMMSFNNTGR